MRHSLLFFVLLLSCLGGVANAQAPIVMESIKASTLQGNVYVGPMHKGKIPYGPDSRLYREWRWNVVMRSFLLARKRLRRMCVGIFPFRLLRILRAFIICDSRFRD